MLRSCRPARTLRAPGVGGIGDRPEGKGNLWIRSVGRYQWAPPVRKVPCVLGVAGPKVLL